MLCTCRKFLCILVFCFLQRSSFAQTHLPTNIDLTQQQDYVLKRVSSSDPSGANADFRQVDPGAVLTLLDANGPGMLTHIWITVASPEAYHLKKLVLRIYWDHETTPSVEAPLGDFFGLGLGEFHLWESELLSVGSDKALNSFFFMPFQKHARVTVSNEGQQKVDAFYFNFDYRAYTEPLLRGKVESPARERLGVRAIVKVEIEGIHFLLAFVGNGYARMLLKRHEEKRV